MPRTKTTPRPQPPAEPAPPRPARRGHRGLTTLEWLLIVAAVAGLAALAVVLVQNVVDETAEQISGSNARITAAKVAAAEITDDTASDFGSAADPPAKTKVNTDGKAKCDRLQITYGNAFSEEGMIAVWQDKNASDNLPDAITASDAQECNIK
ncbi:MAG: hypothetical protein OXG47_01260 [bacterium]|nr:hypothetical protein [bacterium]